MLSCAPRLAIASACVLAAYALAGCGPKLTAGRWMCLRTSDAQSEGGAPGLEDPISVPWQTGFEDGFCGYAAVAGFCYSNPEESTSYSLVTSPVHSGRFAAGFRIETHPGGEGFQTRCVRQGAPPKAAYYGAWYYVPATVTEFDNWNLSYIQGGDLSAQHGLWDLSLATQSDGSLRMYVYDHLHKAVRQLSDVPAVPVGSWFHVQVYLKRAADTTGEIAVYQDGHLALRLTELVTDDTDWGQWYIGNFANSLTPSESTVYVDDVTINDTL